MLENECFLPLWYMNVLSVFVQLIGATWLRATLPPFSSIPGISSRLASRSPPTDLPSRGELAPHNPVKDELNSPPPIKGKLASRNPVKDDIISPPKIIGELASHNLVKDELVSPPPIKGELASHTLSKMSLILLLQSKVSLLLIPCQR